MNYRVDISGSWADHPFINGVYPSSVICAAIESSPELDQGGGLSGSTRNKAIELFGEDWPTDEDSAAWLFRKDNENKYWYSGSQDSIGLLMPGLKKLDYDSSYWPDRITTASPQETKGLEEVLWLVPTVPRPKRLNVLRKINVNHRDIREFSREVDKCWDAIKRGDYIRAGGHMTDAFYTRAKVMPHILNPQVESKINQIKKENNLMGYKLAGAGGGGYLVCLSDHEVKGGIPVKIKT